MEMMENRLLGLRVALRIGGIGTGALAAHADNGLLLGYGAVGLEKRDADRIAAAAPIFARCRVRGWLGLGREIGAQSVAKGRLRI